MVPWRGTSYQKILDLILTPKKGSKALFLVWILPYSIVLLFCILYWESILPYPPPSTHTQHQDPPFPWTIHCTPLSVYILSNSTSGNHIWTVYWSPDTMFYEKTTWNPEIKVCLRFNCGDLLGEAGLIIEDYLDTAPS